MSTTHLPFFLLAPRTTATVHHGSSSLLLCPWMERRVPSRQPGKTYLFEVDGEQTRERRVICTRAMPLCFPLGDRPHASAFTKGIGRPFVVAFRTRSRRRSWRSWKNLSTRAKLTDKKQGKNAHIPLIHFFATMESVPFVSASCWRGEAGKGASKGDLMHPSSPYASYSLARRLGFCGKPLNWHSSAHLSLIRRADRKKYSPRFDGKKSRSSLSLFLSLSPIFRNFDV